MGHVTAQQTVCRQATVAAACRALSREYFGGIWFKVFSERGPSL
jgi:hypothetical protein